MRFGELLMEMEPMEIVLRVIPKEYPAKPIAPGDWVVPDNEIGRKYLAEYAGRNWKAENHVMKARVAKSDLDDRQTGFARWQTLVVKDDAVVENLGTLVEN